MNDSIVIIPTFNERENVVLMCDTVMRLGEGFHILFVDDNSPDGTGEVILTLQEKYPNQVFLLTREAKLGLGTAYIAGFKWALERPYTYVFEMDCDFSHDPKDLLRLKQACENGADVSVGSRYCKGGKVENWPLKRVLLSYFANLYVRIVLWISIKDATAGFKCYRAEALKKINLDRILFKGYAFQICMKYAAIKHGCAVIEIPITFKDRLYGDSKMSTGIFKEALFGVWKMRKMKL
jgi:dolichol-phosphate mannosyltransferase